MTDQNKLKIIVGYVKKIRRSTGIRPKTRSPSFNLSCEQMGKYFNLVERGLVCTIEGMGVWLELDDKTILDGAYRYVIEGWRGQ